MQRDDFQNAVEVTGAEPGLDVLSVHFLGTVVVPDRLEFNFAFLKPLA